MPFSPCPKQSSITCDDYAKPETVFIPVVIIAQVRGLDNKNKALDTGQLGPNPPADFYCRPISAILPVERLADCVARAVCGSRNQDRCTEHEEHL
jgi:hypothetical protein